MKETVAVVIGTFGDPEWSKKAETAIRSAKLQTHQPDVILHVHQKDLATARNTGAEMADAKWIIFLDADDTLDPGYVQAMISHGDETTLRQPSTLGVYPDGSEDATPVLIPARPLSESNFLVIGTMCLKDQFLAVGGFDSNLPVLEDWDLWLRMYKNGAIIGKRPKAIYRIGVNPESRNQNVDLHHKYYRVIRGKYREL